MARPVRIEFAGALYHITARGNARGDIFIDDVDRRHFLDTLADAWLDGHYSQREIGQYFGVSPATVSRAIKAFHET